MLKWLMRGPAAVTEPPEGHLVMFAGEDGVFRVMDEDRAVTDLLERAGGDPASDVGLVSLASVGVPMDGSAVADTAAIEGLADKLLAEFVDHTGRALSGTGIVVLGDTLDLRNVNAELGRVRFQATPGLTGELIRTGRYAGGDNTALSVASSQQLYAWGGDRTAGIAAGLTLFHIETDTAAAGKYRFEGAYAERGLLVDGNVEKKRIEAHFAYCDLCVEIGSLATGSPDSLEVAGTYVNFSQIAKTLYGAFGADVSILWTGQAEGHVAKSDDRNVITDENGKLTTYDLICRTYNGQGTGSYYHFNQTANDYADSIVFGGNSRHIGFNGRAFHAESVRRLGGTFRLRDCKNGRAWTGSDATGSAVPVEAVFLGRVIDAGEFHLDLSAIENDVAVRYGNSTYFSIGCDFGRSHVQAGPAFKPYLGDWPFAYTALDFVKAQRCTFAYSQVHGKLAIGAGIVDCTIRLPATWVQIGYDLTAAAGAVFTLIIEGSLTMADATSVPWLAQITGEQVVVFESISDKGGASLTYTRGLWRLSMPDIETALSLGAAESDLNRYFATTGLARPSADDGLLYTFDGADWVEPDGPTTITVAAMAETTALFARMGGAPSSDYARIYDRLIYRLVSIGADAHWIAGGLLNVDTSTRAMFALLPSAATAVNHDLTVTSGAPTFVAKQGFTFNPATPDVMSTGYDMTAAAEGATRDDFLLLLGARRQVNGTPNDYDIRSANGKAKLRGRFNSQQGSIGTTTTTTPGLFPSGLLIPGLFMAGRVDSVHQFGVDQGRVALQQSVTSAGGGVAGDPDLISLAGSRELWCWGILRARHFFANDAGTIVPIEDRALQLHRAFTEAYDAIEAL